MLDDFYKPYSGTHTRKAELNARMQYTLSIRKGHMAKSSRDAEKNLTLTIWFRFC